MGKTYTTWGSTPMHRASKSNENPFKRLVASVMLALILLLTLTPFTGGSAAYADDGDKKTVEKLQEAQKNLGVTEKGDKGFTETLKKTRGANNKATFASVINRVLTPGYIYNHEKSAVDGYYKDNKKWSCDAKDPNQGLLTYHNCDVPNFVADMGQNLFKAIAPGGIQRGGAESAKLDMPWLGLPTGIKTVPATASARVDKYTALELYGYNLRLTYYAGEYDHIQVQTQARLMGNFGASQTLALGVSVVFNGIGDSIGAAGGAFKAEIAKGNYFGSIAAAFNAGAEGGATGAINTILDTSDANVMATRGYTRVGFDNTLYAARAATNAEMEQEIINTIVASIAGKTAEEVKLPDDLKNLQTAPAQPAAGGTTCIVTNPDGTRNTISKLADENACSEAAKTANMENPHYEWDATDKPTETLKDWKEHNKSWFEAANKYGLTCNVDEDEAKRDETLSAFYSCVPNAYTNAVKKYTSEKQADAGKKLAEKVSDPTKIQDFLKKNPAANFNNPINQYYCLNPDGTDKLDENGKPTKLFTESGSYNKECSPTRAPIKGGVYGTGDGDMSDTRRALYDPSITNLLFNSDSAMTDFSNAGIITAAAITRFANAALNMGMSPILQTFGVDNLIAQLIESFTKSVFFPLAFTCALIGIALISYEIFRGKAGALKTILKLFCGILLISALAFATLLKPHETIRAVDQSTNVVDKVIAEALVSGTIGDEICTATGASTTIKYNTNRNDSDPATRILMCEVWRMNALTPWSYAQWGVGYNKLYAVDAKRPTTAHTFINTNSSQVGRAPVQMGGGKTVNNWALYQLDLMSVGTTTEDAAGKSVGVTDPNMYKIVDLQAGLNNGAGTDSRYLKMWAGKQPSARAATAVMAPVAALVSGFTVGYYAIYKAVIKAVLLLMLVILPFILLLALFGKYSKKNTMKYVTTLLGLYAQSAILTFLLCLLSLLLINLTSAVDEYIFVFLAQVIASIILLVGSRKIMKKIMGGSGIAGTVNMTDGKNILNKTKVGKKAVRFVEGAPAELKHGFARGYTENGLRGGLTEAVKTLDPREALSSTGRDGAVRTILTARSTGLKTARKATEDMEHFDEAKRTASALNQINAAENGSKAHSTSIERMRRAKDIRNARKITEAYQEAFKAEEAEAEATVQKEYALQRENAERAGTEWEAPSEKQHKENVAEALSKRVPGEGSTQRRLQKLVEHENAQQPVPENERFDVQNDDSFKATEKAVHKVMGTENKTRYRIGGAKRNLENKLGERFNHEENERIDLAFVKRLNNEIPEEVENALDKPKQELQLLPTETLQLIHTWLQENPQTDPAYTTLNRLVESILRYRK